VVALKPTAPQGTHPHQLCTSSYPTDFRQVFKNFAEFILGSQRPCFKACVQQRDDSKKCRQAIGKVLFFSKNDSTESKLQLDLMQVLPSLVSVLPCTGFAKRALFNEFVSVLLVALLYMFKMWFSRHGSVRLTVGLDDLRGLFQPS